MRRALPLSIQLLLTFVGLLIGMAAVLTTAAYTSLLANLEADASRQVSIATRTREQSLSQLFQLRQQRAEAFLASLESLCAEPLGSGRLAWVDHCVRPMVDDFRRGERALGALLTYRDRRVRRSGQRVTDDSPIAGALAKVVRKSDGTVEYVMKARRRQAALVVRFDHEPVARLFSDQSGFGRSAEVFLLDHSGQFLTPSRPALSSTSGEATALLSRCRSGADGFVDLDYRSVKSFQSFRPLSALGTVCIGATLPYDEAVAPAEQLRADLVKRVIWFVVVGVVLSLVAAQWISAPVRRLALSARRLQTGQFERPISLGGPSEVRALGRAFNAMGNDLAELVAKEQAARRDAEDASRAKDEFLATVSHELRTPLTAVLGWAHMLRADDVPADRLSHGLAVIERSARAQSRLIDDLLDVTRIVSNRLRMVREPVPIAEVIEAALDAVRPQADDKQVTIRTDLANSALVLGDPRRLEQVVSNLVGNAIKFTQPHGRIKVMLRRTDRQLTLSVSDTGIGISSAFLPYVFEWFRQADARSRSQSGLGLGLGIVRHIVQLHGGSVRAESRGAGQGATFSVTLPVHEPATLVLPAPGAQAPAPPSIAHRLDAARVLVVEDDDDSRELVRTTLESAGATVETVATASDARREMREHAPDVLISDIRMPEEDGYALMRSLRGAGIGTPAIALTAYARHQDADEARAAGFQIHLPKPIDAGRLVDAVAELLRDPGAH
ncbi:MAG TPA: hybrid sensor histidine kinase/response regulator [Vicinamibacterales bacterium]|nr:hybrid sensor histidine kinase/response regulator [Vicinamibacterales bacterium]